MTRCNSCNVEILTPGDKCPLCHKPLEVEEQNDTRSASFPERGFVQVKALYQLDRYFLSVAFFLSFVFLIWEGIATKWNIKIAWIPMAVFLDIFYWLRVRHYIQKYFSSQILTHTLTLCLVALSTYYVLRDPRIIYEYMFPSIILTTYIGMGIYILMNLKFPKKYILSALVLGIFALVPLFLSLIYGADSYVFSFITAIMGGLTILLVLLLALTRLAWEIKKLFHI